MKKYFFDHQFHQIASQLLKSQNMKKQTKKAFFIGLGLTVFLGFIALIFDNYKSISSFKYNETESQKISEKSQDQVTSESNDAAKQVLFEARKNSEILKVSADDFAIGDKNAPVVFIEYASLSCPHCAAFVRESFDRLKSDFIDSGKVLFVFRDFPLNQSALTASMFAKCQAKDNNSNSESYFGTIKALFKTQDSWAFDAQFTEKLESIAKLDGMGSERFKSCINDKSLQEKILTVRMEAAKELQIKSAPSFFVNGEISEGYVDYETIRKLVEKKLAEKK